MRKKSTVLTTIITGIFILIGALSSVMSHQKEIPVIIKESSVIKVVDGDTIKIQLNGESKTIRLIGINTPETVDPRRPVECFGKEASEQAKAVLTGKIVRLENDPSQDDQDKYGRLLRYVYLEDGTFFNEQMIADGYAYEYTYEVPYKYQKEFKAAQKIAQEQKKGLWADNACAK